MINGTSHNMINYQSWQYGQWSITQIWLVTNHDNIENLHTNLGINIHQYSDSSISPHRHTPITYGSKQQFSAKPDTRPSINWSRIHCVQSIVGALLYYYRDVYIKLLADLSDIGSRQASPTELTNHEITQLLNYVATYPNDVIAHHASKMILSGHSNVFYLNVICSRIRAGDYIFLYEGTPVPHVNRPILTIAQIIKFVTSSATKSKLSDQLICAKNMVSIRNTLVKMDWLHPRLPIQT